ncbi:hypothetical protein KGQ19_08400 [Catenulispora sp. NL8]|uniref:Secreted protein n=1 Tax=Catenulispora pinistramenti TaxID=2705254 RepID=A0ABS5KLH3_9ACTN|nr:DUF5719 family protein [Catenulispora pinistramenti]MBS2546889.1 hypothetical protein [Catenulispora pinistramenti]
MTRPTRSERSGAGNRPQRSARPAGAGPTGPTGQPGQPGATRGRGLAKTRNSPISTFSALGVVAVVLLAGLGYGYSTRSQDKAGVSEQSSRTLPIGSATQVCQGEIGAGSDTSTSLTAFTPAGNATTGNDGTGIQYVDGGKPFPQLKFGPPGTRSTVQGVNQFISVTDDAGLMRSVPLVLQANGASAPGFTSSEVLRSDSGVQRGMAGTPCTTPSTDFWFAGVSVGTGDRDSYLYMANTDNAPATVNLTYYGQSGKIDTGSLGHDITILPKTSMEYLLSSSLGPAAQQSAVASVHVTTTEGRVAAQVLDIDKPLKSDVNTGRGMDFIPAQTPAVAAQMTQTIPGIPAPGTTLTKFDLVITATSDEPVNIDHVYWYGKNGRIELAGQTKDPGNGYTKRDSPMTIDADKTVILNMLGDDQDPTESAAVQIVGSGGSFVSGVRLVESDQKSNTQDSAYLAPTPPVSSQAIVADNNIGGNAKSTLILTSEGGKGSTVQVTTIGADGKPATDSVTIGAGSTVAYTPKATGWFTTIVQPQPGSDPVYGARTLADLPPKGGMQFTAEDLEDARVSASVPPVAPDLSGAVTR